MHIPFALFPLLQAQKQQAPCPHLYLLPGPMRVLSDGRELNSSNNLNSAEQIRALEKIPGIHIWGQRLSKMRFCSSASCAKMVFEKKSRTHISLVELRPTGAQKLHAGRSLGSRISEGSRKEENPSSKRVTKSFVFNGNVASFPDLIDGRGK